MPYVPLHSPAAHACKAGALPAELTARSVEDSRLTKREDPLSRADFSCGQVSGRPSACGTAVRTHREPPCQCPMALRARDRVAVPTTADPDEGGEPSFLMLLYRAATDPEVKLEPKEEQLIDAGPFRTEQRWRCIRRPTRRHQAGRSPEEAGLCRPPPRLDSGSPERRPQAAIQRACTDHRVRISQEGVSEPAQVRSLALWRRCPGAASAVHAATRSPRGELGRPSVPLGMSAVRLERAAAFLRLDFLTPAKWLFRPLADRLWRGIALSAPTTDVKTGEPRKGPRIWRRAGSPGLAHSQRTKDRRRIPARRTPGNRRRALTITRSAGGSPCTR
jgi:hypothetical protein